MRVLFSGGGTLGSVTPLLAVALELKRRDPSIVCSWLGTHSGPERLLVERAGIKFQSIVAGKWRRYASLANLLDPVRVLFGLVQSFWWLERFRPQVVVVAGGYVGVPVGWAAWLLGIPLVVHQQDIQPSLSNRLLSWCAARLTVTWPSSVHDFPRSRTVVTGNPVRAGLASSVSREQLAATFALRVDRPVLLVVGGGTGAQFLNQLVREALAELLSFCQVVHLTGRRQEAGVEEQPGYRTFGFLTDELGQLLQLADLVVSRAGMGFLSELAYFAKPAIIVPMPDSHQEANAAYLAESQAAAVLSQNALSPAALVTTVRELLADHHRVAQFGQRLHALLPPDAAQRLAEVITAVANRSL